MAGSRAYRVAEVARLSGVSVRALHHWDAIGLLVPGARSEAGYRLYGEDDLLRLQQVMLRRELGLSLEAIRRSLDDPAFDLRGALLALREELAARAATAERLVRSVDAALARLDGKGAAMEPTELFEGFDPAAYEAEAEERWGSTEAWVESRRRTSRYTEADWQALSAEQAAIYADAAALLAAGADPAGEEARAVVERHRGSIDRWLYPCSPERHRGLADLYEGDERFARAIDAHGAGLTAFLVAAIRAA